VPETKATSLIDSSKQSGQRPDFESAAVVLNSITNSTNASIGANAAVNANKALTVDARTYMPARSDWFTLPDFSDPASRYLKIITDLKQKYDNFRNRNVTTFAQSNDKGARTDLGGAIIRLTFSNTTAATIDENAQVNQDPAFRSRDQEVKVHAANLIESVDVSGLGGDTVTGGKTGVGGSYLEVNYANSASALIKNGAKVQAADLAVDATTTTKTLATAEAGAFATKYAIGAAFSLTRIVDKTLAQIDAGTTINSGDRVIPGTNTNVHVAASDDALLISLDGGITKGANVGIGFSAAINEVNRDTEAVIGNVGTQTNRGGSVTSSGQVGVDATNGGLILATALAGRRGAGKQSRASGSFGVAISGDAAVNTISDTAVAALRDANIPGATGVAVTANNTSGIDALAGSVTFTDRQGKSSIGFADSYAQNTIQQETTRALVDDSTLNLSGALGVTAQAGGVTRAITASGTLENSSGDSTARVKISGAVSVNEATGTVEALIRPGSRVTTSNGGVTLTATDGSEIMADGGGVALARSTGKSSVDLTFGLSIAINDFGNAGNPHTIRAAIEDSTVASRAGVTLAALASPKIDALTIGGAVEANSGQASGGLKGSGAGAGSGNTMRNTVEAFIAGSQVNATGAVQLTADDTSIIHADGGGVSVLFDRGSTVGISVGLGLAVNDIENATRAMIDQGLAAPTRKSTVTAGLDVALTARSVEKIDALTIAGAASGTLGGSTAFSLSLAGAGAGSGNRLRNSIEEAITNGSTVTTQKGSILLTATDEAADGTKSKITADAGAVALRLGVGPGTNINVSVGASAAVNDIQNNFVTYVKDSTVNAADGLALSAKSDATIDVLTVAGAGAIGIGKDNGGLGIDFAGAGTGSGNKIGNTTQAFFLHSGVTTGNGAVTITAADSSTITARAVAGSLAVNVGSGAAISISPAIVQSQIANTTRADIADSVVTSAKDLKLDASSTASITSLAVGVAASVNGSTQGSVSLAGAGAGASVTNKIQNTIEAYVTSSSHVTTRNRGDVDVSAKDQSVISAVAAGGSLSISFSSKGVSASLAIGVGLAYNDIADMVRAYLGQSTIDSAGGVNLLADSASKIKATAIGVGASVAITDPQHGVAVAASGAGAEANNSIKNTIMAFIGDNDVVTAPDMVTLTASDRRPDNNPNIQATASGVSVSAAPGITLSVGVVLSANTITSTVDADIQNAAATSAAGNVELKATSDSVIVATLTPVSVAAGVGGAGAGANVGSTIGGHVRAFVQPGANVSAPAGLVKLDAESTATATADTMGGSGSIGLAVSASFATAGVSRDTLAFVADTARVTSRGLSVTANATNTATADLLGAAIGLGSGAGGKATAKITGNTVAYTGAAKGATPTGTTTIDVGKGAVTVGATAANLAHAQAKGGAGGGITINAALAEADVGDGTGTGATRAFIGEGTRLTGGSLETKASGTNTATAELLAITVGVIGGSGGKATAAVNAGADVEAQIAANSQVTMAGSVLVDATASNTATATSNGGTGGGINVSAMLTTAELDAGIKAAIAGNVLNADGVTVRATAPTRLATSSLQVGVVGLIAGGAGGKALTTIKGDIQAAVAPGVTINCPRRLVQVSASAIETKGTADAQGGSGSVGVTVSAFLADASVGGDTTATIGAGAKVTAAGLTVEASNIHTVTAHVRTVGVGIALGGSGGRSSATSTGDVTASVGSNTTLKVDGNLKVDATYEQAASTDADGGAGAGGIAIGVLIGDAAVRGGTTAFIGSGTQIGGEDGGDLKGDLEVKADNTGASAAANVVASGAIVAGGHVAQAPDVQSAAASTAYLGAKVGARVSGNVDVLANGRGVADVKMESKGGAGLVDVGLSLAEAAASPTVKAYIDSGAQVTARNGSVTVRARGDEVFAQSAGTSGGISAGAGYKTNFVATAAGLIDSYIGSKATVNAGGIVTVDAIGNNTAATRASTFSVGVFVNVGEILANAITGGHVNAYLDSEAVVRTAGQQAKGLDVKAAGSHVSTATVDLSGGGAFNKQGPNATAYSYPAINAYLGNGSSVDVIGDVTVKSTSLTQGHANTKGGGGGIVDVGTSKANVNVTPTINTYIGSSATITAGRSISVESVHGKPPPAKGDFDASAVAESSTGGVISVDGAAATVHELPRISASAGAGAHLSAGGDIAIRSTSYANTLATGTNSIGFDLLGGKGDGKATILITNANSATLGDRAVITTQGNFTLQANSFTTIDAHSDAYHGAISGSKVTADTVVFVSPVTQVSVGQDAQVTARSALRVEAQSTTRTRRLDANADSKAAGVEAKANAFLFMGVNPAPPGRREVYYFPIYFDQGSKENSGKAITQTTIGRGAALTGRDTTVNAVASYDLESDGKTYAFGGAGKVETWAVTDICDSAYVKIDRGVKIIGSHAVDIEARHDNVRNLDKAEAGLDALALGAGEADSYTHTFILGLNNPFNVDSTQPGYSQVDAAPTATIYTPDLTVKALATFDHVWKYQNTYGFSWIHKDRWPDEGEVNATRHILWNADVVVSRAAVSPLLIVDANGHVDPSSTIKPDITPTQIIVPDIGGAGGTGHITFVANQVVLPRGPSGYYKRFGDGPGGLDGNGSGDGFITSTSPPFFRNPNDLPTFYFQRTTGPVQILNDSAKELVINNIDVLDRGATNNRVDINVKADDSFSVPFHFKFAPSDAPTLVDIENRSTTGSPNITLKGLINNPIGTTIILNARGSILPTGPKAVVRTNILDVEAANGQIGSGANALSAELVQSADVKKVARPIQVTVLAGGSAYLNLKGILRDPDFNLSQGFTVPLKSIHAGGDIVATLKESERDSAPASVKFGVSVYEDYDNRTTFVASFFRPDQGPSESLDPGFFDFGAASIDSVYDFVDVTAGHNINLQGLYFTKTIHIKGNTNINPEGPGTGHIDAFTNGHITLIETAGAMRVGSIQSTKGNVKLTVPDLPKAGQDLVVLPFGEVSAFGHVNITAGGNVEVPASSHVRAGLVFIDGHLHNTAPTGVTIDVLATITATGVYVSALGNNDIVNLARGQDTTLTVVTAFLHNDTVNVRAVGGPMGIVSLVGPTTINVGSTAGVLGGIVGEVDVEGSGLDTLNVDDTGDRRDQAGTLTDKKLTGLSMGQGITYSGLRNLNVYLGSGDDTFAINEINPPTRTLVDGGGGDDRVTATFRQDFQGDLPLVDFETGTVQVNRDFVGLLHDLRPAGNLQSVNIGGSLTASGLLHVDGNVGTLTVGQDVAGHVAVIGNLDTATVLGSVLNAPGITIIVGGNLGRLTVGRVANNQPVPGNVSGPIWVFGNFDIGYVYGTVSNQILVGGNVTSILEVFGNLTGSVQVAKDVAEMSVLGSQSGSFSAGGNVTLLEIGAGLTRTGTVRVGGDLWSMRAGSDSSNPGHGLFGQVVVAGNLFQLQTFGALTGTVAIGGDVGVAFVDGGDVVAHYGGLIVDGLFSGQLVALGNVYGDLWVKGDLTGRIAVKGHAVPGLDDPQRFGILGNVEVDGWIGASGAIFSGGLIGDAASGTGLWASGVAGILAAKGDISLGAVDDMTNASMFAQASGVNAAAIDAIFTDRGCLLTIDTTPRGLSDLDLILKDLASLYVDSNGNLKGLRP
jgi:hypothetical protein